MALKRKRDDSATYSRMDVWTRGGAGDAGGIALLRRTVSWLNEHRWEDARKLSTNQKERAADVHLLKGAKRNGWQTPSG